MACHVEYRVGVMVSDSKWSRTSRGLRESFTINLKRAVAATIIVACEDRQESCGWLSQGGPPRCPAKRVLNCPWWLKFRPASQNCRGSGHGNCMWTISITPTIAIWAKKCRWPRSPKWSAHRAMSTPAPRSSDTGASSMRLSVSIPIKSVTR